MFVSYLGTRVYLAIEFEILSTAFQQSLWKQTMIKKKNLL